MSRTLYRVSKTSFPFLFSASPPSNLPLLVFPARPIELTLTSARPAPLQSNLAQNGRLGAWTIFMVC